MSIIEYHLEKEMKITDINKSGHIRQQCVKYLRERGKYTVVSNDKSKKINHTDQHRHDLVLFLIQFMSCKKLESNNLGQGKQIDWIDND